MKKLFKRSLLSILALSTILSFSGFNNVKANERKPKIEVRSWPGRPGNPDGIGIETNTFSGCKQSWRYSGKKEGRTAEFEKNSWAKAVGGFLLSTGIGSIPHPAATFMSAFLGGVLLADSLTPKTWEGEKYVDHIYYSDNCLKIVRSFYTRYGSFLSHKVLYTRLK